ncbi:MAG: hypothetical protein A2096_17705 [Spirochaetes bacterium GWF1_41_5]|nr:MAG: hypothetical protein A2096_17705 [Spirochaetes bacterium GWF1_41_5]HBE01728.1 hypothetical protein [Spirochaetia bacterium]
MYKNIKYTLIADDLEKKIRTGALKGFLPPLHEIIDIYHTTQSTATKAIRILKKKRLITYKPGIGNMLPGAGDFTVRQNVRPQLRIAYFCPLNVLSPFKHDYIFNSLSGVINSCREYGSVVEIFNSLDSDNEKTLREIIGSKTIDGIIYDPLYKITNKTIIRLFKKSRKPVILIGENSHKNFTNIDFSDRMIIKTIHAHADLNRNTYLLSYVSGNEWMQQREEWFKKFFRNKAVILRDPGQYTLLYDNEKILKHIGYNLVKNNFHTIKYPATIIGINHLLAYGAMRFFLHKKIKIPDAVSIIGIDSSSMHPLITTVKLNLKKIGYFAALLMHKKYFEIANGKIFHIRIPGIYKQGITS